MTQLAATMAAYEFLERASPGQLALLRAMPLNGAKKWRAVWRHAKRGLHAGDDCQLPFRIAEPTLMGSERLTIVGREAKWLLERHVWRPIR